MSAQRVVVVGASSGIGRAVAAAAAAAGARVAVAARRREELERLAADIRGSAHVLDIGDASAIPAVVETIAEELTGIDVLFISSAVMPLSLVEDTSAETWARVMAVNATGPSLVLAAALPYLTPGAVVLIASSDGVGHPRKGLAAYSASKAALDEILTSWRAEHPDLRLVRLIVGPTIGTDISREMSPDVVMPLVEHWAANGQLPGAVSTPADVATTVLALIEGLRRSPSLVTDVVRLAACGTAGSADAADAADYLAERGAGVAPATT